MTAHQRVKITAEIVASHYEHCSRCQRDPRPCPVGDSAWAVLIRLHSQFLQECIGWHHKNSMGATRARLLISKLTHVTRILAR
jgi:hypothetical protein